VILVDTSGLLALLDRGEPEHARVTAAVRAERGPLVVTDLVLAETDFLVLKRLGREAERDFVAQLLEGVFLREAVTDGDLRRAHEIGARHADLALGLTDATLMALGERLRVRRVLTLDRRHFAAFRDHRGRALELVPT
jgi:hypothetical protein